MTRQEIDELLCQRSEAKRTGNYHLADILRGNLAKHGITITDAPDGQIANGGTEYELRQALSALEQCKRYIKTLEDRAEVDRKSRAIERAHMTRTVYRLTAAEALLHQAMPFVEALLHGKIQAYWRHGQDEKAPLCEVAQAEDKCGRCEQQAAMIESMRAVMRDARYLIADFDLEFARATVSRMDKLFRARRPNPVNSPQTRADADA